MKNILIPTDFTIKSLKTINAAVAKHKEKDQSLKIYLVHALEQEPSISGLLFFKKRSRAHFLYSDSFLEACEMLKNKHHSIVKNIQVEFYFGQSKIYKKNFLEARNIDAIVLPLNYQFEKCSADSVDPFEIWKQQFVPTEYVSIAEGALEQRIMADSKAALFAI